MRTYVVVLLLVVLLFPAFAESTPSEQEVKTAIQSLIVASAVAFAAQNFTPPLSLAGLEFVGDNGLSSFSLSMEKSDVGSLRLQLINQEPPQPKAGGLFELLFASLIPSHQLLLSFLRLQALLPEEAYFSGTFAAKRVAAPFPFRYEGGGSFVVSGKRFVKPFTLDFSFRIPLEGPQAFAIVPLSVFANGIDFLPTARALFGL
ncbi:MAG: hypothetical protein ACOXZ4_01835 [Sphaerochaetaceae bacterium]